MRSTGVGQSSALRSGCVLAVTLVRLLPAAGRGRNDTGSWMAIGNRVRCGPSFARHGGRHSTMVRSATSTRFRFGPRHAHSSAPCLDRPVTPLLRNVSRYDVHWNPWNPPPGNRTGSSWATRSGLHRLPKSSVRTPQSRSSMVTRRVRDSRDWRSITIRCTVVGKYRP